MTLPIKMNLDGNRLLVKDNVSNYNMNTNFSTESNAIHNEYGFLEVVAANGLDIIGYRKIFNNQTIIFSVVDNPNYASEIGILKDGLYKPILRDNIAAGATFGFSLDHLIQAEAKLAVNGDIIVYWVDGYNTDKFLNITTLQIELTTDLMILDSINLTNMLGFRLNSAINIYLNNTDAGGNLFTGVYYVLAVLSNNNNITTHSLVISNPIPINPITSVNDGSVGGIQTSRKISIHLLVSEIPDNYDTITFYTISKINGILTAHKNTSIAIPSVDFDYEITTLTNTEDVTIDSLIINSSNYISALTLAQVDDILYKGNLRSTEDFDFQPYINNIKVNYRTKLSSLATGADYRESVTCFYDKSFMYDEVYALYASLIIEDNGITYETKAYNIPGRLPKETIQSKLENDRIDTLVTELPYYSTSDITLGTPLRETKEINSGARIFHGLDTNLGKTDDLNMSYWENLNETYSNENSWVVKNSSGIVVDDFRGQNVRHHKFPSGYNTNITGNPKMIDPNNTNSISEIEILGVELNNIVIPSEYVGKVKKIKLFYAKRTLENRTVLGQSLAIPEHRYHKPSGTVDNLIFNASGNFWVQDIFMVDRFTNAWPGYGFTPINIVYNDLTSYPTSRYPKGVDEVLNGAASGNYHKGVRSGTNWSGSDVGFISMRPFDLMLNNTNISSTHIKNVCRIKGQYETALNNGDTNPNNTSWWTVGFQFNFQTTFMGVDMCEMYSIPNNQYYNRLRKLDSSEFLYNTSVEDDGFYWLKGEEDRYVLRYPRQLFRAITDPSSGSPDNNVGQDHAIVWLADNVTLPILYGSGYTAPYLTNICAFKEDIYSSFDNQILCFTGLAYELDDTLAVQNLSTVIYGGDTFTNLYGERSSVNFDPLFEHSAPPSSDLKSQQIRTVHYYPCQSTSNIRLRYEGANSWEVYYPKSNVLTAIPADRSNYYGYNLDYSSVNDIQQPTIALNSADNDNDLFPNRVIKSQVNNPEILQDNYLIFLPGDETDVGLQYGQIEKLFNTNNKLGIHMTDNLMITTNRQQMNTSDGQAYIGAGNIFDVKPQNVNTDFYGGVKGRYASCMTPYGYFFVDTLNFVALLFDGAKLEAVSDDGMERFFYKYADCQLPYQLNSLNISMLPEYNPANTYLEGSWVQYQGSYWISKGPVPINTYPGTSSLWKSTNLPEYDVRNTVNSMGYSVEYDPIYDRVIFHKKDYLLTTDQFPNYVGIFNPNDFGSYINADFYVTFNNKLGKIVSAITPTPLPGTAYYFLEVSYDTLVENFYLDFNGFTLSYYPKLQSWVSFYSYFPKLLVGSTKGMFSNFDSKLFEHNYQSSPFFYTEDEIHWFVEPLYRMNGNERLASINLKTEKTFFFLPGNPIPTYNTYFVAQSETFDKYFVYNKNQMSFEKDFINTQTSRDNEGYFNFNDFRDFTTGINPAMFIQTSYDKVQNLGSMDANKHWSKQRKFVDFWQSARLSKTTSEFIETTAVGSIDSNGLLNYTVDVPVNTVLRLISDEDIVKYVRVVNKLNPSSQKRYEIQYLLGEDPFPSDTTDYRVAWFSGYNLSLLDTNANKKPDFR